MRLVKRILNRRKQVIIGQCEMCGRMAEIPYSDTINPHMATIDLKGVIRCECGEYHNLIVDSTDHRPITSPPAISRSDHADDDVLRCPRCQSTQLHVGDKGFSVGKAAVGHLLVAGVGLIGGFIGSKKIMITCLKCGYKWQAGKR